MNSWRGRREFQRECHKKHKYCTSLLAHLFRILQILEAKCKIINLRKGSSTRLWFQICCGKKPNLLLVSWSKLTWAYFSDGLVLPTNYSRQVVIIRQQIRQVEIENPTAPDPKPSERRGGTTHLISPNQPLRGLTAGTPMSMKVWWRYRFFTLSKWCDFQVLLVFRGGK